MADRKHSVVRKGGLLNFLPLGLFNRLRRTQHSSPGMALVLGLTIFTILLWAFSALDDNLDPYVILAKITAFGGIALLALNHVLSLRARILEVLFGGLDKLYHAHHLVGQIAFLMMLLHPVFLALNRLGSPQFNIFFYLVPRGNVGVGLGILALYTTLALLIVTLVFKLRYHIWHLSHHLMLIPLVLSLFHALQSGTYMGNNLWLRLWVSGLCIAGIVAYVHVMVFYHFTGPMRKASVVDVKDMGDITQVSFKTHGKPFRFKAGQFVFIRFLSLKQEYELFPFSLSGAPDGKVLRISAKKTGDFTSTILPTLEKGAPLVIWGPYGRFGEHHHHKEEDAIWLAGGIGITPFISMAHQEASSGKNRKVLFIWSCKSQEEAVYHPEITEAVSENPRIKYVLWTSNEKGNLNAEAIIEMAKGHVNPGNMDIFICGPPPMLNALGHQFLERGIKSGRIFYEDFSML